MKERWIEVEDFSGKRQEEQFSTWLKGAGIDFESPEAEERYRERVTLIKDAIQLRKIPKRIPVCPSAGFFPISYGGSTHFDVMYNVDELILIWEKYCNDFNPDTYNVPNVVPGKVFDTLDFHLYKWAGHGVSKDSPYQFVEGEYMKAEEYEELIDDPSGFFLRFFFSRIFGALKSFEKIPNFPIIHEILPIPPALLPFGTPELRKALSDLMEASSYATAWIQKVRTMNRSIMGKWFPSFSGGFSKAPFDVIGDSLRGTVGIMMDIYRHPDELLEACERLTPFMIKAGVSSRKANGHSLIFIPLHKGSDSFMSEKQFSKFYWPTLRKVIIGLVNEGFVPLLFAEGQYKSRLEIISDVPKGTTVWWFEQTDMALAKEKLGSIACRAGNVPISILCAGSEKEVKDYCRRLIDIAGRDGGFILSTSAGM